MSQPSSNGSEPGTARARVVALLALADEAPMADELTMFLVDPEPVVRRAAVDVLTESAPPDAGVALARLLDDPDPGVRRAAGAGLRELREVLVPDQAFADELARAVSSTDFAVRATVIRLWWEHRLGEVPWFVDAARDPHPEVRREAVAGLVSLDAATDLAALAGDEDALVRLAIARGIATLAANQPVPATEAAGGQPREEPGEHLGRGGAGGDPGARATLIGLAGDEDVRVKAAATEGLGAVDVDPSTAEALMCALRHPRWEVRKAAAQALKAAPAELAVPPLVEAAGDPHIDVRRAAVQSLATWRDEHPAARRALEVATADPDADVRGYARLGLA